MNPNQPSITLNNGVIIPQLGFGTWFGPGPDPVKAQRIVESALTIGYRHIDSAAIYETEGAVGAALRASGLPRDQVFITTKLRNQDQPGDIRAAFEASLTALGLDYVDLYLIHWPLPALDRYVAVWQVFEQILADGAARAIGVSNFKIAHLEQLRAHCQVVPAVNQVELHPRSQQLDLREYHREHGIATEAWSPLASHHYSLRDVPAVVTVAQTHGRSVEQVTLRWQLQQGLITIPRSQQTAHQAANFDVFDFELTSAELAQISAANGGYTGTDPDSVNL